jgi:signal transduction histidine kinase/streptogramin lyase
LGNVIASLYKDEDGIVWVGNWGQGLNKINRVTSTVEQFSSRLKGNHYIPNDFIHVIFRDSQNHIWLGTRNGILIYDKPGNKFVPWNDYFRNPALPSFKNIRISTIIQDISSNYWVGTQNGLFKINLNHSTIEVFKKELDIDHQLSGNLIYCLLEDSEGLIWIATLSGLDLYNPFTKKIRHFRKEERGLYNDFIISLCEDSNGRIWIGTSSFVNVFDKKDSTFSYYSREQGLPNNQIYEILKDNNQDIWVATGKGLCKFDKKKNNFHNFTLEDGLQSLEFNLRAAYACKDGEILMGGMNGFNSFFPDSIYQNPYLPNLVFTSFYITKGTKIAAVNLEESPVVTLNYNDYPFTIEFAALEYTNPQKNNYAYRMEGISDEWVSIGNRKFVPFSALQPGEYTFMVKGSNNDGVWNDHAISTKIIILPPWWKSSYAFSLYLLVFLLFIYAWIKLRERKLRYDKKILEQKVLERTILIEQQNQMISSKNQELDEMNKTKDKFFSIIGHDLGNQFNIIVGFSEVLVSDFKKLDADKIEHHLNNIYNSSKHANDLLDNLLIWAKMQTKTLKYNPVRFNVHHNIAETIDLLEGAYIKKNISLQVVAADDIYINADVNMFSTVVRNLVSNAIKFTPDNGSVSVHSAKMGDFCEITIQDNGLGISETNIQKIFKIESNHSTLGTNGEKGTGLGLVLCKEFIEKHNGTIRVESMIGKGSKFIFTLPLGLQ